MKRKHTDKELEQRILTGKLRKEDVARLLAELAFGRVNDCVKLVLEDNPMVDRLDLAPLCEVRRNDKGTVEIKLVDRLRALEQLLELTEEDTSQMDAFLSALKGGEETV